MYVYICICIYMYDEKFVLKIYLRKFLSSPTGIKPVGSLLQLRLFYH